MSVIFIVLTIVGLSLFEIISSIDNAIINTRVLHTMKSKSRRWFLVWGILIGVFLTRGMLPWMIVWFAAPSLGPIQALTATFSDNEVVLEAIKNASPKLMIGGGTFLILLFLHWLLREHDRYFLPGEKFFKTKKIGFFATSSVIVGFLVWASIGNDVQLGFSAMIGALVFFVMLGIKTIAEHHKRKLLKKNISDIGKLAYLELIDMAFSVDNVLGVFAFTLSIPIIMFGSGIGALIVRKLTIKNMEIIVKYKYLINGAMYSIAILGFLMVIESFGFNVPEWVSPIVTIAAVSYFVYLSKKMNRR